MRPCNESRMVFSVELTVVSWNINGGLDTGYSGNGSSRRDADRGLRQITRFLGQLDPDIVCLQEAHSYGDSDSQAASIAHALRMPFHVEWPLDSSHHIDEASLALAVLSKFEIVRVKHHKVRNPQIGLNGGDSAWSTHEKGFLATRIAIPTIGEANVLSGHMLPFHRFNACAGDAAFRDIWEEVDRVLTEYAQEPAIVGADFNFPEIANLLPAIGVHRLLADAIGNVPTSEGQKFDYVLSSSHWTCISSSASYQGFDHLPCTARFRSLEAEEGHRPCADESTLILHLSDLHFGEMSRHDEEWKVRIKDIRPMARSDRLRQYLLSLERVPDFVVISGDFTVACRPDGYEEYARFSQSLVESSALPPPSHTVVVPGNHDVLRRKPGDESRVDRFGVFNRFLGQDYVRPWLRDIDASPDDILDCLEKRLAGNPPFLSGAASADDRGIAVPFLLHLDKQVLIYAFNSAAVSGSFTEVSNEVEACERALRDTRHPDRDKILTLIEALDQERQVDPARVEPDERYLFSRVMTMLREKYGASMTNVLKVAVLHHHIVPMITEEAKKFELLINAAAFKKELTDEGFKLVLHGHKHYPVLLEDSAIPDGGFLGIIAGGTIGGDEAPGKRPAFNLVEWTPREPNTAHVSSIEMSVAGDPRTDVRGSTANRLTLCRPVSGARSDFVDVMSIHGRVEGALLQSLKTGVGPGGDWVGWGHYPDRPYIAPVASAYGLRIIALLRRPSADILLAREQAVASLLSMRVDGQWRATSSPPNQGSREATAFVLLGLAGLVPSRELVRSAEALCAGISSDNQRLKPDVRNVYTVCLVTSALSQVVPDHPVLDLLASTLCDAAEPADGPPAAWRETLKPSISPWGSRGASVVHTAHALLTLASLHRATGGRLGLSISQLRDPADWLVRQRPAWASHSEDVYFEQADSAAFGKLSITHFTRAWVVCALLEAGFPPDEPCIEEATHQLAALERNGFWSLDGRTFPIWATHDALNALTVYALKSCSLPRDASAATTRPDPSL